MKMDKEKTITEKDLIGLEKTTEEHLKEEIRIIKAVKSLSPEQKREYYRYFDKLPYKREIEELVPITKDEQIEQSINSAVERWELCLEEANGNIKKARELYDKG